MPSGNEQASYTIPENTVGVDGAVADKPPTALILRYRFIRDSTYALSYSSFTRHRIVGARCPGHRSGACDMHPFFGENAGGSGEGSGSGSGR